MFSLCAGLLGAAPTVPLLANPALSAALLQMLLQNQAKAQQVPPPFLPFFPWLMPPYHPACFLIHPLLLTHTPPLLSALSLLTISKPFWEIISFGLRCCTIKKTLLCLV